MTKTDHARLVAWRMKVLHYAADGPRRVAQTCRHFGISRPTFYKWKKRYAADQAAGLSDRPRTPRRSPRATSPDVVSKILYLRQHYHFGAGRIRDYLKRFHDVGIARSSVHRLLGKHGMGRLPANQKQRPQRHALAALREGAARSPAPAGREVPGADSGDPEAPVSVHRDRRLHPYRVLKVFDACNQATAIQFADEVLRRLPFRERPT